MLSSELTGCHMEGVKRRSSCSFPPTNEIIFTSLQCHSIIRSMSKRVQRRWEGGGSAAVGADHSAGAHLCTHAHIPGKSISHSGRYTNPLFRVPRVLVTVLCSVAGVTCLPLQESGQLSVHCVRVCVCYCVCRKHLENGCKQLLTQFWNNPEVTVIQHCVIGFMRACATKTHAWISTTTSSSSSKAFPPT